VQTHPRREGQRFPDRQKAKQNVVLHHEACDVAESLLTHFLLVVYKYGALNLGSVSPGGTIADQI
jgi:hypothetical protein